MTTKSRTVVVLLVACVGFSHAQPLQRLARVELNGEPLLQALMVSPAAGWPVGEPYVSLRDLRLAIDGRDGPERSRLREDGRQLMAVATGGCDGCRLRVARTVLVSGALRSVGGEPHVPLSDIVRALEGRLDVDWAGPVYRIHAGICRWCVLEVAGRSPPRGGNSQGDAITSGGNAVGLDWSHTRRLTRLGHVVGQSSTPAGMHEFLRGPAAVGSPTYTWYGLGTNQCHDSGRSRLSEQGEFLAVALPSMEVTCS
jgi:hypothetical protein